MTDAEEAKMRAALLAMAAKAEEEGLWFHHAGLSGRFWFSPGEIRKKWSKGKFLWGPVNWSLRDPAERLGQLVRDREAAEYAVRGFKARMGVVEPRDDEGWVDAAVLTPRKWKNVWVYAPKDGGVKRAYHNGNAWVVGPMDPILGPVTHWKTIDAPKKPRSTNG